MKCRANPSVVQDIIDKEVARRVKEMFDLYTERFYVCIGLSMCDVGGLDPDDVLKITGHSTKLCEEVTEGRISFDDMKRTLWDEYHIKFEIHNTR